MSTVHLTSEQICERGQGIYDRSIRAAVEPNQKGNFVAIDVETGEYAVNADQIAVVDLLRARQPEALIYLVRVGHPAVVRLGSRLSAQFQKCKDE